MMMSKGNVFTQPFASKLGNVEALNDEGERHHYCSLFKPVPASLCPTGDLLLF